MALGNVRGVLVREAVNNQIGDEPNLISGNVREGLRIFGSAAIGNIVQGNLIGTNAAGDAAVANRDGVAIASGATENTVGGATAAARNVISGNSDAGVLLQSSRNTVAGNFIGTDADGTSAVGNENGVVINNSSHQSIGGFLLVNSPNTTTNVISGNFEAGIRITGDAASHNQVVGNLIGTDLTGSLAVGNKHGVVVESPMNSIGIATTGKWNVISGNTQNGVHLVGPDATGNTVQGNRIGISLDGMAVANGRSGVLIEDAPGNLIGGPYQVGGFIEPGGNSIGGHSQQAIKISGAGAVNNQVQGNRIGIDLFSQTVIPNRDGVRITDGASGNAVGGQSAAEANEIAYNTDRGVWISDGTGNTVSQNSIRDNGGLGISLGGRAVTPNDPNDADTGANGLQNFPVITSAVRSAGNTTVSGTLNSLANSSFSIEFFSSPAADPSGHGEGEQYLGSTTVNTDGNGGGSFSPVLVVDVPSGHVVTATATDSAGNTSEFSAAVTVSELLLAAAGPAAARPAGGSPAGLTANQLQPTVDAAIDRLTAVGFAPELFANVEVAIADLPGATLGLATGNTITLDVNAAGYGWVIDEGVIGRQGDGVTVGHPLTSSPRHPFTPSSIDLLTVVMHELGHVAGLEDLSDFAFEDDLMYGWLEPGVRKTSLDASLADEAFSHF